MDTPEQASYYDRRWTTENAYKLDEHELARAAAIDRGIQRVLRDQMPPWRILDVGCGRGWISNHLSVYGHVVGVDLSRRGIDRAQQHFPHIEFEARDVMTEGFPPGLFDVVVSSEVLEHVPDQRGFIELLSKTASPRGHLVLTTPNAAWKRKWMSRTEWEPQPVEQWVKRRPLSRLLKAEGWRVLESSTFYLGFDTSGIHRFVNSRSLRAIAARLGATHAWDQVFGRLGLGLYTIVVAQRRPATTPPPRRAPLEPPGRR